MPSDEHRAIMISRLDQYLEMLNMHLAALHRMYNEHLIPESIYLQEVAATSAEIEAVGQAAETIRKRKNQS
jgi:hypothetical protein